MSARVKRIPLPDERRLSGVIADYNQEKGEGVVSAGDEGDVPFNRDTLTKAGYSRIVPGAEIECYAGSIAGALRVVGVIDYRLPKQTSPPRRF